MSMDIIAVGLGGFLGALTRYFFYRLEYIYSPFNFPLATLTVNIVGCFFMGALIAHISKNSLAASQLNLLLGVGFLGSLTTFSTFSADNYQLILAGHWTQFFINIVIHIFFGLLALAIGLALTTKFQTL